jgi:hypothetical protein
LFAKYRMLRQARGVAYIIEIEIPGAAPIIRSALVLVVAALFASLMRAARVSRVDAVNAQRAD